MTLRGVKKIVQGFRFVVVRLDMRDDDFATLALRLDSTLSDLEGGHSLSADVGLVLDEAKVAWAESIGMVRGTLALAAADLRSFSHEIHLSEWVSQALNGLRVG